MQVRFVHVCNVDDDRFGRVVCSSRWGLADLIRDEKGELAYECIAKQLESGSHFHDPRCNCGRNNGVKAPDTD
jgi:hypothetical protein